jgi:dTMP kinase
MRGRFITFEGGEGTGKSTHSTLLGDRLTAAGIHVLLTREPGGSPGAEAIRHVLLTGVAEPLGVEAEALLFAAARSDHVRNTIEPALTQGTWVISDRFIDSTRVYQGILGHLDPVFIRGLERVTVGDLKPDLTFILDVPAEVGLAPTSGVESERPTGSRRNREPSTRRCARPIVNSWLPSRAAASRSMPPSQSLRLPSASGKS